MEPNEVKQKWPEAWQVMSEMLANAEERSVLAAIKAGREASGIGLVEAKRILVAIQEGKSLESHQEELIGPLKDALDEDSGP